jgi:membrane protein DedA with SNARE-associated domain
MGLVLLFLAGSLATHFQDMHPAEVVALAALGVAIGYAIFVAWRAVRNAR